MTAQLVISEFARNQSFSWHELNFCNTTDFVTEVTSLTITYVGSYQDKNVVTETFNIPVTGMLTPSYDFLLIGLCFPVVLLVTLPYLIPLVFALMAFPVYFVNYLRKMWNKELDIVASTRNCVGTVISTHAKLWHGYEVIGLENIPKSGPVVIVYYHGSSPIDIIYLVAHAYLQCGRAIENVVAKHLLRLPGFSVLQKVYNVSAGDYSSCLQTLKAQQPLSIAPGGLFEAQLGNGNYQLLWNGRTGFAKLALEANAPIIPMFTRNIREANYVMNFGKPFWTWVYHKTKRPLAPVVGTFPVKLTTFIGQPIYHESDTTPEELAKMAAQAMERLISQHQKIPHTLLGAMRDRL